MDWLDRLKDERSELRQKYNDLAMFFGTETYTALPETLAGLLKAQYSIMEAYITILNIRIAAAETTN